MAFVRQTQDGVNGNSSTGIPVEYEHNKGVGPYVYRTGITAPDSDGAVAFSSIPSFKLSGERIFFHKLIIMPVLSTQALTYNTDSSPAGINIRLILLRNMSDTPSLSLTANNTFQNGDTTSITVPAAWKPILVKADSVKSLLETIGAVMTVPNFAIGRLPPGEYKILLVTGATADLGGGELSIVLAHTE